MDQAQTGVVASRSRKIRHLISQGQLTEAGHACERLVQAHPEAAQAWAVFSELWLRCGQHTNAIQCATQALELEPDAAEWTAQLAKARLFAGEYDQALTAARQAASADFDSAETADTLGNVFSLCGDQDAALEQFRRAHALDPDHPGIRYNLATSLRVHGETDEAEAMYDRIIAERPEDAEAWYNRSQLRTWRPDNNHIDAIRQRLEQAGDDRQRVLLQFTLARELEDTGDYAEAFSALQAGGRLRKAASGYRVEGDLEDLAALTEALRDGRLDPAPETGHDSDEPIFITGLPRSGTTLVERILGQHSQVFAAGELMNFPAALQHAAGSPGRSLSLAAVVERLADIDFAAVGRNYVESTRPRTGQTGHFTDKFPGNAPLLPLIHRALPRARLILVRRDPMDVCYAMFKTLFNRGYEFTYDLEDLGRYHRAWQELMDACIQRLGRERITVVDYESLVTDPEPAIRDLLEACSLDWEPACLEFHRDRGAVATASSEQVRAPIYQSSVGKWRKLESELQPLKAILEGED